MVKINNMVTIILIIDTEIISKVHLSNKIILEMIIQIIYDQMNININHNPNQTLTYFKININQVTKDNSKNTHQI